MFQLIKAVWLETVTAFKHRISVTITSADMEISGAVGGVLLQQENDQAVKTFLVWNACFALQYTLSHLWSVSIGSFNLECFSRGLQNGQAK